MVSAESVGVLRGRGEDTEVSSIELFFDLVYCVAAMIPPGIDPDSEVRTWAS
jgi:hypothetical protein